MLCFGLLSRICPKARRQAPSRKAYRAQVAADMRSSTSDAALTEEHRSTGLGIRCAFGSWFAPSRRSSSASCLWWWC